MTLIKQKQPWFLFNQRHTFYSFIYLYSALLRLIPYLLHSYQPVVSFAKGAVID